MLLYDATVSDYTYKIESYIKAIFTNLKQFCNTASIFSTVLFIVR